MWAMRLGCLRTELCDTDDKVSGCRRRLAVEGVVGLLSVQVRRFVLLEGAFSAYSLVGDDGEGARNIAEEVEMKVF